MAMREQQLQNNCVVLFAGCVDRCFAPICARGHWCVWVSARHQQNTCDFDRTLFGSPEKRVITKFVHCGDISPRFEKRCRSISCIELAAPVQRGSVKSLAPGVYISPGIDKATDDIAVVALGCVVQGGALAIRAMHRDVGRRSSSSATISAWPPAAA